MEGVMKRAAYTLEKQRFSITQGKLTVPVLEEIVRQVRHCLHTYETWPEIWIGTDSQKTLKKHVQFSPSITVRSTNKMTRIYYTKFTHHRKKIPLAEHKTELDLFNKKRLETEGKITIAIADALQDRLYQENLSGFNLTLHFDYNEDPKYVSNLAYKTIQELIKTLDFPHKSFFKPVAFGSSKTSDRIIRKN